MTGHLSNMTLGVGADHILFGWVFFGVVILVLFWLASFWRDPPAEPSAGAARAGAQRGYSSGALAGATAAVVALAAAWPGYAAHLDRAAAPRGAPELSAAAGVSGWRRDPAPLADWRPRYVGAAASTLNTYRHGEREVALYIAYYRDQRQGAELVHWENTVLPEKGRWIDIGGAGGSAQLLPGGPRVRETRLQSHGERLLVWEWYRVSGTDSGSPYLAKALLARDKLLGRGDDSAAIVIAAPYRGAPQEAAETLRQFAREMQPSIRAVLAAARGEAPE